MRSSTVPVRLPPWTTAQSDRSPAASSPGKPRRLVLAAIAPEGVRRSSRLRRPSTTQARRPEAASAEGNPRCPVRASTRPSRGSMRTTVPPEAAAHTPSAVATTG